MMTETGSLSPGSNAPAGPAASRARRRLGLAAAGVIFVAAVAAGTVGTVRYASMFWLYRGFPPPSVPHSVAVRGPHGPRKVPVVIPVVQSITVRSPALGGFADPVFVVLPPGYASHPRSRYPVLYLLHGFPGQPQQFLNVGQVSAVEATLVAAGRMKPMIIVLPTGTRSFLADEEWANGISRGNGWETFVARALVGAVDARYRTIANGRGRAIGGLSEGGYGALNIGLHHPAEFTLLESWSGYMMADNLPAVFGYSPSVLDYNSPAMRISAVASPFRSDHGYIWFYGGSRDSLSAQNRAFAAQLSALHVPHHFFLAQGKHNWALWRRFMPQALIAASDHLSHG